MPETVLNALSIFFKFSQQSHDISTVIIVPIFYMRTLRLGRLNNTQLGNGGKGLNAGGLVPGSRFRAAVLY